MSLNYDVTKDIRFQQGYAVGFEKGYAIGLKKGYAIGLKKGIEKSARQTVLLLLALEKLTIDAIADVVEMPIAFVLQCQKELEDK
jgi:flagellar biosynthesis/type III secretory pathway protein FliH